MSTDKPPLDLHVLVKSADGVTARWASDSLLAMDRPDGINFTTKRYEGFSTAGCTLPRRIDLDYPDLALFDDFSLIGYDGSVAYEGRIASEPRSFDQGHSIDVSAVGWMANTKDRKFSEIYVDKDITQWNTPSAGRRAGLLTNNFTPHEAEQINDPSSGEAGHATAFEGAWVSPYKPVSEAWYDAGPGNTISMIRFCWRRESGTIVHTDTNWSWIIGASLDANASTIETTSNLQGGGTPQPGPSCSSLALSGRYQYAFTQLRYDVTPGSADGVRYAIHWYAVAVYGGHSLTQYVGVPGEAPGVLASDVVKDILKRFCPELNSNGVQSTSYVIPHLVFRDRTDPYSAIQEVNKFHLWEFAVWEDRTLYYGPSDLTDYDWEVRLADPGTTVQLQGDSTEELANGIVVQFTDITTATTKVLTPDDYTDLRDGNPDNPANEHGLRVWTELELSSPTTVDAALQSGRIALAEFNQPKAPGSISVTGHIRDRAGRWHQAWKVRAGDRVAITDHPNSRPRLITESGWDHGAKRLTVSVDSTVKRLDAILDRFGTAIAARSLA